MAITLASEISYNEVKKPSLKSDKDVVRSKNTEMAVYMCDCRRTI